MAANGDSSASGGARGKFEQEWEVGDELGTGVLCVITISVPACSAVVLSTSRVLVPPHHIVMHCAGCAGTYATVRRVRNRKTGQEAAVKILVKDRVEDLDAVR